MKFLSEIKLVSYLKNDEMLEETLALLKILALGNYEIEQDKFSDIENVFAALDQLDSE